MSNTVYEIRNARPEEFKIIGQLMVQVYSDLEGFPKESEQPMYYKMLENVGDFTNNPKAPYIILY